MISHRMLPTVILSPPTKKHINQTHSYYVYRLYMHATFATTDAPPDLRFTQYNSLQAAMKLSSTIPTTHRNNLKRTHKSFSFITITGNNKSFR